MKTNCTKCGVKLVVGENIVPSGIKWGMYRCKSCQNTKDRIKVRTDPIYKLKKLLISKVRITTFKNKGEWRKNNTLKHTLGIDSRQEWLDYIENQFVDGMCWENYGEWELDHIIELHTVNTIEDINRLNHHTNIQPLWKEVNSLKHNLNRKDPCTREEVKRKSRESKK